MRALVSSSSRRQQQRRHHARQACPPRTAASFIWNTEKGLAAAISTVASFASAARAENRQPGEVYAPRLGTSGAPVKPAAALVKWRKRPASRLSIFFPLLSWGVRLSVWWPAEFCSLPVPQLSGLSFALEIDLSYKNTNSELSKRKPCLIGLPWDWSHQPALEVFPSGMVGLKMLPLKLLLVALVLCFFEGETKFGETTAKRRRCLNGSPPRRLKKRDRRLMLLEPPNRGELLCQGFYPRLSCCSRAERQGLLQVESNKIFSVTNNTECVKLLQEIRCAHCSPNAQNLFHSTVKEALERELALPFLCKDYCKEFYYTCRGHIPGLLQITADDFCFYYARKDGGFCFPDFPRKQVRGPSSNYLDQIEEYGKEEDISRKHKHNCFCLHEVVSGFRQPVGAVHSGDGSHRLFILEKEGYVKILTPEGDIVKEPFLDIHKVVQSGIKGGDERGLLSLAFHPDYKKNGKLYVSYTTNQERWAIGPHDHILRIVEYTVSRKNPHQVDMRTARPFLEVAELHRKHLGGQLFFDADGFLYIILGDGMITIDDMEEMDGLSDFTGSVLRLDVDTDFCHVPYSIPQSNPHFNSTNQPPEIFAHGLHNPGRCAVDRHPTDVNINLTILCSDSNEKNRSSARIIQIIKGKDYESEPSLLEFKPFSSGPLIGGFIYRGCQSERLHGSYIFADRNGNFLTLQQSPITRKWQEKPLCLGNSVSCQGFFAGHILGFGEDESGEVYILASSKSMTQSLNGKLYKIIDPKRPLVPEECKRTAFPAQILTSECSRHCQNGHCTPTGKCCCNQGWEGEFCRTAKCDPVCRHGGVCIRPNKCLCKKGYLGSQCEQMDRNIRRVTRAGIFDQIIDMTSYLLDLTSYIV